LKPQPPEPHFLYPLPYPVIPNVRLALLLLSLATLACPALAQPAPIELHHRLRTTDPSVQQVALTLDACSGQFDEALIEYQIHRRIPATLFVTKRWLDRNPVGVSVIKSHLDLFDVEDHGERHRPAIIGADIEVYGIAAHPDVEHLRREVLGGARAVEQVFGVVPRWYRGATALYDKPSISEIDRLGYRIAGFSVNADAGATRSKASIIRRLSRVRTGDVIIAHMNKPDSDTAEGLAVGLATLVEQGFVFVRLDQVELQPVPDLPARVPRTPASR
jgi:peptidoglycan/xylan/chitin deacetylase (PgdA/CDA1 family)